MPAASDAMVAPAELLLEFLQVFSRFEYALKAEGFSQGDEYRVDAAWDDFARAIAAEFDAVRDSSLLAAVEYLLTHPPRKQVLKEGKKLGWRSVPPDPHVSRAEQTLLMTRRVRNNLFHGSKLLQDYMEDATRDRRLVESALCVLQKCTGLLPRVRDAFESHAY